MTIGNKIPNEVLNKYLDTLVNSFFKILPIMENENDTLDEYMKSLQVELVGCNSLFENTRYDSSLLSLVSILQYLIDHNSDSHIVRREVFKSIAICKRLKKKYFEEG